MKKLLKSYLHFRLEAVRFESNHMAFTNVMKTEKKIRVMQIINTSDAPVKVEFIRFACPSLSSKPILKHLNRVRKALLKVPTMLQKMRDGEM